MAGRENKEKATGTAQLIAYMTRTLRNAHGLTQEELGKLCGYSAAAISGVETCAQPASDEMLVKLESTIGRDLGFFQESRIHARIEKYPVQFREYAPLEASAVNLSIYSTLVVHGLFQTEEYARALIAGGFPILPDERVEELVKARTARQAILDRESPAVIEYVVEESVLLRQIGTREVMKGQLRFLADCAKRRNVTIYVLSLTAGDEGEHAGVYGDMTLVETAEHEHLVYLEPQNESILISNPAAVSAYAQRYARMRAQALVPRESLGLIERLAGEQP
ncbi:helix-turn-helix domain-containing protein [Streptomyces thermolilacinus]|uniref:Transcriptional regulator n=1 Tax=Streptomyces thermolilacinus SPC6 TaxID=1306406 RepID=A0A1D3DS68_9ACTN|nr:Scr1 family TA system antitoxin-like transcriptional regulator [Streptomyces thermolilacinus]OEJ95177.1 transcriptional regulator [Streptomyces thermolilacinus SPC6]